MEFEDYKKYKWFYTSSGKLVVGGKNAEQNDELLSTFKKFDRDYWVMHTSSPGSPFSIIIAEPKSVKKSDLKECAIFTACFSRAWKSKAKKEKVDIFKLSQVSKQKGMKTGTWGVFGKIERQEVSLKLVLTRQEGILRAVPEPTIKNKKEIILRLAPGNIDKRDMVTKLHVELGEVFKNDELLAALPAGGMSIIR